MMQRRTFLTTAATATGGLVISMYLPACSKPEEAAKNAGPVKQVAANAWLRIGTDGSITVLCDRSEMGQGVYTALPTLIAEVGSLVDAGMRVKDACAEVIEAHPGAPSRRELYDVRFEAEVIRGLGGFETEQAAADDRGLLDRTAVANDLLEVLDGAINKDALLVDARHRRHERDRTRGEHDHVIRDFLPARRTHDFLAAIDLDVTVPFVHLRP